MPQASPSLDFRRQESYKRRIHHIGLAPGCQLEGNRGGLQSGGWERDVADTEFPKRPSMLDDVLRRSLIDIYRSESGEEAGQVQQGLPHGNGEGNEFNNDYEAGMDSGTNISLRKLQEQLERQPLDEIAMLVRALTYGEMIEFAEGVWKVQPEGSAVTQENLPALLHKWSQSRTVTTAPDYPDHQDADAE